MAEHLRRHTSQSSDKQTSLKEYVDCMNEGQNDIYYTIDEIIAQGSSSPSLKMMTKEGLEAFYMVDP
eukprot:8280977-Heterocapsa_arctica.AAC.1